MKAFVIFGYEDDRGVHIHGSDLIENWQLTFTNPMPSILRTGEWIEAEPPTLDLNVCMLNAKSVAGLPDEWYEALQLLLSKWSPNPQEVKPTKELTSGYE